MTTQQLQNGINFIKKAGYFGRYLNMTSLPNRAAINNAPVSTALLRTPIGALSNIAPGAGLLLGGPVEMAVRRNAMGPAGSSMQNALDDTTKDIANKGYLENMTSVAKPMAATFGGLGLLGGLGYTAYNAVNNYRQNGNVDLEQLKRNLSLTGLVTGAGALSGASAGAMSGAVDKAINNHTAIDSKERAKAMVAKHPYLTSLPFGNIIGAAFA